jgi:hypothetical protein
MPFSVEVEFTLREPPSVVLASVRRALEGGGWKWTEPTPVTFPGQNHGAGDAVGTWAKTLPGDRPTTAALTPEPEASWRLIAEAPATLPPPKAC